MNADGKIDRREFIIAMVLIKRKLQGYDLPATLPLTLLRSSDATAVPNVSYPGQPAPPGMVVMPLSGLLYFAIYIIYLWTVCCVGLLTELHIVLCCGDPHLQVADHQK